MTDHGDTKSYIKEGYDQVAERYLDWTKKKSSPRLEYVEKLFSFVGPDKLPNSTLLELGCGAGTPVAVTLASKCQHLIASDISSTQISLATKHLREADILDKVELVEADMTTLTFKDESFDAVAAFYAIIHLSLSDQRDVLAKIHKWLKNDGYLVCNFGAHADEGSVNENWLGMKSFWSSHGSEGTTKLLTDSGFEIVESQVISELDDADFLWIVARKR